MKPVVLVFLLFLAESSFASEGDTLKQEPLVWKHEVAIGLPFVPYTTMQFDGLVPNYFIGTYRYRHTDKWNLTADITGFRKLHDNIFDWDWGYWTIFMVNTGIERLLIREGRGQLFGSLRLGYVFEKVHYKHGGITIPNYFIGSKGHVFGASLGIDFSYNISPRWLIATGIGVGYGYSTSIRYDNDCGCYPDENISSEFRFYPTRVLSLTVGYRFE